MKKVNLAFCILVCGVAIAAILHTGIAYLNFVFAAPAYTSAPAEVAFLLLVPYALGIILLLLVWLIVRRICRKKHENNVR